MNSPTLPTSEGGADLTGVSPGSWRRLGLLGLLIFSIVLAGGGAELVALGVLLSLILLHEGGHFLAARATKMHVHQFFVGFGPVIWSMRRNGVEYGIKAIPLGGFVKIAGMSSDELEHPHGYQRAGALQKLVVVGAGPATNLLIGLVVAFLTLSAVGLPEAGTTIAKVDPRLGAAAAGVRPGDRLIAVNGTEVDAWSDLTKAVNAAEPGSFVQVAVQRGDLKYQYNVRILLDAGERRVGVQAETQNITLGIGESARGSVRAVSDVARASLTGVRSLVTGFAGLVRGVFGASVDPASRPLSPVGAVQVGAEIGSRGLFDALNLVMLYSTFLAVFNLLPVPPLDGGRMLVVVIEKALSVIRRKKIEVSVRLVQQIGTAVAMVLLAVGLIAVILDFTQPVLQ